MDSRIVDGTGSGTQARVNGKNRLDTQSFNVPVQMAYALEGRVFQVEGAISSTGSGTYDVLFMENESATRSMVVTYIRMATYDLASGTALPSAATQMTYGFGLAYTSGGTTVTPVNTNSGSANVSEVTCYTGDPTTSGTQVKLDTWTPQAEGLFVVYNKEGSVIVPPGETFSVRITTDHTSGVAYSRVSFMMIDPKEL